MDRNSPITPIEELCAVCGNRVDDCVCCPECSRVCVVNEEGLFCPVCGQVKPRSEPEFS
jgi:hypothetical protein